MKTIIFGSNPLVAGFDPVCKNYRMFNDCIRLARHYNNSGDVVALTVDTECNVPNVVVAPVNELPNAKETYSINPSYRLSTMRWTAIAWYCRTIGYTGMVYSPDWDVFTFGSTEEVLGMFAGCDVCRTEDPVGGPGAAWAVKAGEFLDAYCKFQGEVQNDPVMMKTGTYFGDMHIWSVFIKKMSPHVSVGTLSSIVNGSTFDHNVHTGQDQWVMEKLAQPYGEFGEVKKIVWENRFPYFVLKESGKLVKANCIHCWGSFKSRTGELVTKAIG